MRQSLLWNAAYTQLAVQTLAWTWESTVRPGPLRTWGTWLSLAGFAYLSTYLPPGGAWLHEEWHRAVLARRGAGSRNGVYDLDIGASVIAVDHVADADLARLKADHPEDFVRLMSAGIEAETEAHRQMRLHNFLLDRSSEHDRLLWWPGALNSAAYLFICATGSEDKSFRAMEGRESDPEDRDFTGPDFTAWVYDLRRPEEDYAAGPRGRPHPSGTDGYRRYLVSSDLTSGERRYLGLQAALSLFNLSSPQFWGVDHMPGRVPWDGRAVRWNGGLSHYLTPYGFSLGADLWVRRGKWSWALAARAYANADMALPGLKAQLLRYPWRPTWAGGIPLRLTAGAAAWLQPGDLRFHDHDVVPGGSLLAGVSVPIRGSLEAWAEADAKSAGWVAGNVHLDPAVQARAGLALRL
ncbi:MAG TPA: hypothetical protein VK465_18095 [Fibrobacteria bacterium]|nr:hypothetical protein [Fibrobacteria bacterium]